MKVVLLGPPGSGKGTQAALICGEYGLEHLSTGNILREEMERGTELGSRVSAVVKSGALVDDETVNRIVFSRIAGTDSFLLDGYPRNIGQATALDGCLGVSGGLDCVLLLDVPQEEIVRRLSGRVFCPSCGYTGSAGEGSAGDCPVCGSALSRRPDDSPEVVRRRLAAYREMTAPLEGHYAGRLCTVEGSGTVQEVWARVREVLDRWR